MNIGHKKVLALGRLKTGQMNNLEAKYAVYLDTLLFAKQIQLWRFEALKLRLADNTFYTADFCVMASDGVIELHEVKGFWQDDARVKIKVAASMYPFRFFGITEKRKKDGGGWQVEEF